MSDDWASSRCQQSRHEGKSPRTSPCAARSLRASDWRGDAQRSWGHWPDVFRSRCLLMVGCCWPADTRHAATSTRYVQSRPRLRYLYGSRLTACVSCRRASATAAPDPLAPLFLLFVQPMHSMRLKMCSVSSKRRLAGFNALGVVHGVEDGFEFAHGRADRSEDGPVAMRQPVHKRLISTKYMWHGGFAFSNDSDPPHR